MLGLVNSHVLDASGGTGIASTIIPVLRAKRLTS